MSTVCLPGALGKPEEGVGSPGTVVTNNKSCHVKELNVGPLKEQLALLIAEPSLQPYLGDF